ncbi:MAG: hypothetical protein KZQ78_04250 [Candidatus Thiodiazotropha sp. (ex Ustalcina ferruginea)]|nr:hypothetical protein [Candidatus Thiodiazotropha sp. (ex Ustalcina ferruginea)]
MLGVHNENGDDALPNPPDSTFIARHEVSSTMRNRDFAPYPNDIWFIDPAVSDGTLNVPHPSITGFANIDRNLEFVNTLDGFSTTSSLQIPFNDEIDFSTVEPLNPLTPSSTANIIVLDADAGTLLTPGIQYDVEISTTTETGGGAMLNILPLSPLKPNNTYMFYVMTGITNT